MMHRSKGIFLFSFLIIFVIFLSSLEHVTGAKTEVEDEKEFDYKEGSDKGPEKWGDIHPEWEKCKTGTAQSPIDLSDNKVQVIQKSPQIEFSYKPADATIKNRGHDIMIQWKNKNGGDIKLNETHYHLQQSHWHTPGEHTTKGMTYDLELHMVHVSHEDELVVIAVLYQIGPPDSFLNTLIDRIVSIADKNEAVEAGVVNPKDVQMDGEEFYTYMGSLTVPPCTEGVKWLINKKIMTVSRNQVEALRNAVHDDTGRNARPVQANKERVEL